jgi:hypothetical protein
VLGAFEDLPDPLDHLGVVPPPPGDLDDGSQQTQRRPDQLRDLGIEGFAPVSDLLCAPPDVLDGLSALLELLATRVGELVDPLAVLALGEHQPLVLELREGGVHGARAGPVHPTGSLLEAVLGPLPEQ